MPTLVFTELLIAIAVLIPILNILYSCMPNTKRIIISHIHKILRSNVTPKTFNCKKKITCHFNGDCLLKGVYKTIIRNGNKTKEYINSTGVSFKARYTQHRRSFKSSSSSQSTLSKYVRKSSYSDIIMVWSY